MVTLQEMKNYLRVDDDDDDALIETIIASAERQCMDILRTDSEEELASVQNGGPEWEDSRDVHRGIFG